MCCPKRYTASIASVNRIRVRRSGMRNTLAMASKNFVIGSLAKLPGGSLSRYFSLADHGGRSAGGLDLLAGGFGKHVRRHVNGSRNIAGAEHLQPGVQLFDRSQFLQAIEIKGIALQLVQ